MLVYIGFRHNYRIKIKRRFCITIWTGRNKAVEWLCLGLSKTRPGFSFLYAVSGTSQGWVIFNVYTTGEAKIFYLWRKKRQTVSCWLDDVSGSTVGLTLTSKGRSYKSISWTPHPSSSSVFSRWTLFSKQQSAGLGSGQELLFPLPATKMEWGEHTRRCVIYRSWQRSPCFALQCKCRAETSRTWSVFFFQFIKEILNFLNGSTMCQRQISFRMSYIALSRAFSFQWFLLYMPSAFSCALTKSPLGFYFRAVYLRHCKVRIPGKVPSLCQKINTFSIFIWSVLKLTSHWLQVRTLEFGPK